MKHVDGGSGQGGWGVAMTAGTISHPSHGEGGREMMDVVRLQGEEEWGSEYGREGGREEGSGDGDRGGRLGGSFMSGLSVFLAFVLMVML